MHGRLGYALAAGARQMPFDGLFQRDFLGITDHRLPLGFYSLISVGINSASSAWAIVIFPLWQLYVSWLTLVRFAQYLANWFAGFPAGTLPAGIRRSPWVAGCR